MTIQERILNLLSTTQASGLTASEIAWGIGIRTQPRQMNQLHAGWAAPVTEVVVPLQELLNAGQIERVARTDGEAGWLYAVT